MIPEVSDMKLEEASEPRTRGDDPLKLLAKLLNLR